MIDIFVRKSQHQRVRIPSASEAVPAPARRAPYADSPAIGPRGLRTHQRVLDAAIEAFGESGYDRTTLDRIAELAGLLAGHHLPVRLGQGRPVPPARHAGGRPDVGGVRGPRGCDSRRERPRQLAGLHRAPRRHRGSLRADHPGVRGGGGVRPVPGGWSGLDHPPSRRRPRSPGRRHRCSPPAARPDRRAPQHGRDRRAEPHVDPPRRRARALRPRTGRRRSRRRRAPSALRPASRSERPPPPRRVQRHRSCVSAPRRGRSSTEPATSKSTLPVRASERSDPSSGSRTT